MWGIELATFRREIFDVGVKSLKFGPSLFTGFER